MLNFFGTYHTKQTIKIYNFDFANYPTYKTNHFFVTVMSQFFLKCISTKPFFSCERLRINARFTLKNYHKIYAKISPNGSIISIWNIESLYTYTHSKNKKERDWYSNLASIYSGNSLLYLYLLIETQKINLNYSCKELSPFLDLAPLYCLYIYNLLPILPILFALCEINKLF